MKPKRLMFDAAKCTGCQSCALACSVMKFGECNPYHAAVRLFRNPFRNTEEALFCRQCDDAPCVDSCAAGALFRDGGQIRLDTGRCTLCRSCAEVCPHQGITFIGGTGELVKCDLCGGNPVCTAFCSSGALTAAS